MDLSTITVADFKNFFVRDFPYLPSTVSPTAENATNYVLDSDITRAFGEAQISFNQSFYPSNDTIKQVYLYLTAHYLVGDLKAAIQGLSGTANFPVSGRTVGNITENYAVPEKYKKDPMLVFYTTSYYGLKYLNFALPYLRGNVVGIYGRSHA